MLWFKKVTLAVVSSVFLFSGFAFAAPAVELPPVSEIGPVPGIDPNMPIEAIPAVLGNVQQAVVPYGTFGGEWSCGLSVHNMSSETVYYRANFYNEAGTYLDGLTFSIPAHGSKTDALINFNDGDSDIPAGGGTYSVYIRTLNKNNPFAVTAFVGNSDYLKGFGFQSFFSQEVVLNIISDPAL